ncbi:hypothetical protein D3C87_317830 [compost metagenome]
MRKKANSLGRLLIILFWGFGCSLSKAQEYKDVAWNDPRVEDSSYYAFREKNSIPPFSTKKIQFLIDKRLKALPDEALTDYDAGISVRDFNTLTFEEKFTYTMIYPEIFSQACAERMFVYNPQKKIFGQLLFVYNGVFWSERQISYMKKNKVKIVQLIQDLARKTNEMGLNYKSAILEMSAWESIPFLIDFYERNPRDKDILTTLLLLLKVAKLSDFEQSKIYAKLYGPDTNYESWINFSEVNVHYIIETATAYYNLQKGK